MNAFRYRLLTTSLLAAVVVLVSTTSRGEPVQDFTLPSATDGSLIRLSDYSGKVVLIHFWQTTCGWCVRETPKLAELEQKYGDRGLRIIGVSCDRPGSVGNIPQFMEQHGVAFPVGLSDRAEFGRDILPSGTVYTPCNFLVSRDGEIENLGPIRNPEEDWHELEREIERRLAEPVPEQPAIEPRTLRRAPEFELESLDGRRYSLDDFAGRPMVVTFFTNGTGSWAGEVYSKLHEDYASQGLQVLGIHLFGEEDEIRSYIEEYDVEYPVLRGTRDVQRAWIGSNSAWATFLVTADGRILKKWTTASTNGMEGVIFPRYVESLLAEQREADSENAAVGTTGNAGAWEAWHRRGLEHFEQGELQQAANAFSRAIELKPDYWRLWYDRAWARHGLDEHQQAIDDSAQAIKLNPDHWGPWGARGMCFFRLEQFAKAVDGLSKAIELGSDEDELYGPVFRVTRGTLYAHRGQLDKGVADLQKAKELAPEALEDLQLPNLEELNR